MSTATHNLSDYTPGEVPSGSGRRFALVISEWNKEITEILAEGAYDTLISFGVDPGNIFTQWVPGSFELPLGAQFILEHEPVDAVILLGCIIQGETRHFDFICQGVTQGTMEVGLKFSKPVVFGILTTLTMKQAKDRAGGKHGNKGVEAAVTALKMVSLKEKSQKHKK
ncbi:MAG: 6,7-dimethyl-8-ribityllumazine synthase [Bacteroidales bacterium]|nr:6,7-dimethyl-8-ribityllumazine synthase [Bacteroidales bacterium]